jgi:hypothetical protein
VTVAAASRVLSGALALRSGEGALSGCPRALDADYLPWQDQRPRSPPEHGSALRNAPRGSRSEFGTRRGHVALAPAAATGVMPASSTLSNCDHSGSGIREVRHDAERRWPAMLRYKDPKHRNLAHGRPGVDQSRIEHHSSRSAALTSYYVHMAIRQGGRLTAILMRARYSAMVRVTRCSIQDR